MKSGNTICQLASVILAILSFCLVISSLSTRSWLDDQNPFSYDIYMGVQEFEIRGGAYDGLYTFKDDINLLEIIYGKSRAGDFEDAAKVALGFGILAGLCQFVGITLQISSSVFPKLAILFKSALVSLWLSGLFVTIGLIAYIGIVYDHLEGDMGYNSSFAMSACSGIFVSIAVGLWWVSAPSHEAISWQCSTSKAL